MYHLRGDITCFKGMLHELGPFVGLLVPGKCSLWDPYICDTDKNPESFYVLVSRPPRPLAPRPPIWQCNSILSTFFMVETCRILVFI